MNSINLSKKIAVGFAVISIFSLTAPALAAAPTGTCGFLASWSGTNNASTLTAGSFTSMDVMGEMNFSTNTVSFSVTQLVNTAGVYSKRTVGGTSSFTLTGPNLTSGTAVNFTATAGTGDTAKPPADVYQMTFNPFGGGNVVFNILPVNSGNTILFQGTNDKLNGVCQML